MLHFSKTIISLISFLLLISAQSYAQFESEAFGEIIIMNNDNGSRTVYVEYIKDGCDCDVVSFDLYEQNDSDNYASIDGSIVLEYFNHSVYISNKNDSWCCQVQSDMYDVKVAYDGEEEFNDTINVEPEEYSYESDHGVSDSIAYSGGIEQKNTDLSFLTGRWKEMNIDMHYDLKYDEEKNTVVIINGDGDMTDVLDIVGFCGDYDHVFSIILQDHETCWYIDDVSKSYIVLFKDTEDELVEYLKLLKMTD
jgi:hypothetical protein